MRIYRNTEELIGNTPLLELSHIQSPARILVKLEFLNPGGSVKDRVAKFMLDDAEARGLLCKDSVIIEPTSGNTGIGLCLLAALRGYRAIIVMPDTMSRERIKLMEAYGAEVLLVAGGMSAAIAKAEQLAKELPHGLIPGQFTNPANSRAHFETTGPEIWDATEGQIDILVAGISTGGTITGTGAYLKTRKPITVVGVEPATSAVLSGRAPGPHGIQGIGAGFIPEVLDLSLIDEILPVTEEEAFAAAKRLAREEGILAGISSGAALHAALFLASRPENANKTILTILPDPASRYLSTEGFL